MANEFKIRKGLIVEGASGGTVVDVQGSQGQLFSVTDDLSGSIFAVSDISGVPILDVNSSGLSTFDGAITSTSNIESQDTFILNYNNAGNKWQQLFDGSNGWNLRYYNSTTQAWSSNYVNVNTSGNATFAGNVLLSDGTLTVGADAAGRDVIFRGGTSGAYFMYDASEDGVVIVAPTDEVALGIRVVGGGQPTVPQFTVGRGISQYLGIKVDDRISSVIHRQDETSGVMQMNQEIWDNGDGIHKWNWISADGAGASASTKMTLNKTGELNVSTSVTSTTLLGDLNGTINTATTGTTQAAANNSTLIATTAYADAAAAAAPIGNYLPLSAGSGSSLTDNLYINDVDQNNDNRYGNLQSEVGFTRSPVTGNRWFKVVTLNGSPKRLKLSIIATGDNTNSYDNFLISTSGYGMYMHIQKLPGGKYNTSKLVSVAAINPSNGGTVEIWIQLMPVISNTGATYVACTSDVLDATTILASSTATAPTLTGNDTQLDISNDNRLYATLQTSRGATFGAKVGIGTNSPAAMLTVAGGDATISGNVGIGTTDTSRKLSIFGTNTSFSNTEIPATIATIVSNQMTDNNYHSILQLVAVRASLTSGQNSNGYLGFSTMDDSNNQGVRDAGRIAIVNENGSARNSPTALTFWTNTPGGNFNNTPATEKMRIASNGNVGIGTTSPNANAKLHLYNSASSTDVALRLTSNANSKTLIGFGDTVDQTAGAIKYDNATSEMSFEVLNSTEAMRIDSDGNVGIGTTSPGYKLDVRKNQAGYTYIASDNANTPAAGTGSGFAMTESGSVAWYLRNERDGSGKFNIGNSSNRLTIDSSGNVGIGTTNPRDILEIEGNMRFVNGEDHLLIKPNHTTQGADFIVGDGVEPADTPIMSLDGQYGGKVTIETSVGSSINVDKTTLDIQGSQGQLFSVTDDLSGDIFSVADISGVPIMNVNSSGLVTVDGTSYFDGNVGINTSNPTVKLEITGHGGYDDTPQVIIASGGADSNSIIHFTDDDGGQVSAVGIAEGNILTLASNNDMIFKTDTGSIISNSNKRMIITSDGKVGIGTTGPGSKLEVSSGAGANGDTILTISADTDNSTSSSSPKILMLQKGSTKTSLIEMDSSNRTHFSNGDGYYFSGGNVGINQTNPAQKLHIHSGRMLISNNTTPLYIKANTAYKSWVHHIGANSGYIFAPSTVANGETWDWANSTKLGPDGVVTAKNFKLSSDERLKNNIKDIEGVKVNAAFKSFEMESSPGEKRYGVVAQELEKNNPELVTTDEKGFKSVMYIDLLIAKIAELEARLEKLEK